MRKTTSAISASPDYGALLCSHVVGKQENRRLIRRALHQNSPTDPKL